MASVAATAALPAATRQPPEETPVPQHRDPTPPPPAPPRPLLVTASDRLCDDVLRLAAAAGVVLDVAHDPRTARAGWAAAPLVVVGSDAVPGLVRLSPPRRPGVVLVGLDLDDGGVWQQAVDVGAETVVLLPDGEQWLVDRLADCAEGAGEDARVVGVIGGRGGAGATCLAVALAMAGLRAGLRTLLLDADPLGGGIDLVLGGEGTPGLRWPELAGTRGRVSGGALREALPRPYELPVLSWDRGELLAVPAEAVRSVLAAARRSHDLVVVDLPRSLDPAAEEVLARTSTVLLVVPAELRAVASAGRVAAALCLLAPDVRVVVRGPSPGRLRAAELAALLGLPLAGELAAERSLSAALERGLPPGYGRGPLADFADRFVADAVPRRSAA